MEKNSYMYKNNNRMSGNWTDGKNPAITNTEREEKMQQDLVVKRVDNAKLSIG